MVWIHEMLGISRTERCVLLKLAGHANRDGGNAFPSVATMADYAVSSERTIQSVLSELLKIGVIALDGPADRKGGKRTDRNGLKQGRSTVWRIVIPPGFDPKNKHRAPNFTPLARRSSKPPKGEISGTKTMRQTAPKSVLPSTKDNRSMFSTHGPVVPPVRLRDDHARLLRDGIPLLIEITGCEPKAAEDVLERLLLASANDCRATMWLILRARHVEPADPVAWLFRSAGVDLPPDQRAVLPSKAVRQPRPTHPAPRAFQ